jgi:hypothetical protein
MQLDALHRQSKRDLEIKSEGERGREGKRGSEREREMHDDDALSKRVSRAYPWYCI